MEILLIIGGMALVTFIPRLLPAVVLQSVPLPGWVRRWLETIPYAALGALIFPGILEVAPERPEVGLVGGAAAAVLAWLDLHIIWIMAGAITAALGMQAL
jgi:branched-subunit amino acid transport protein